MNRKKTYTAIAVAVVAVLAATLAMLSGDRDEKGQDTTDPEDALKEFYSELAAGNWDGISMNHVTRDSSIQAYIAAYREMAGNLQDADSSVLALAADMVRIHVTEVQRHREKCTLEFNISLEGKGIDGKDTTYVQHRKAGLRMEDGKWKVAGITE